jgi:hypothetical protein
LNLSAEPIMNQESRNAGKEAVPDVFFLISSFPDP